MLLSGCLGSNTPPITTGVFAAAPDWTFETDESIIATPIVYGDALVVRTEKHVTVLDASTRKVRWTAISPGSIYDTAPPLVADGILVTPEGSNPVAAFDLASGTLLWRNCFPDLYLDPGKQDCLTQPPTGIPIDDLQSSQGIVTVSEFGGDLTAYNIRTGSQLWTVGSPRRGGPSVAIDNGTVYLDQHTPSNIVELWAVDLKTSTVLWRLAMNDVMGKLVALDGILYYSIGVGDKSRVAAITGDGSTVLWDVSVDGGSGSKATYLSLNNDLLYVAGNQLTAISVKDGKILWRTGDHVGFMRPVIFGDIVLARDQHLLYAFDKRTGVEIGRLSLELAPGGNNVELNPAVYNDLILVPVGEKQIAAYRLKMPGH